MWRSGLNGWVGGLAVGAMAGLVLPSATLPARGESLESALMQAYRNNPTLNSQRASLRATDEGVPQALSGYRPRVTINASGGEQSLSSTSRVVSGAAGITSTGPAAARYFTQSGYNASYSAGATLTQTIFNGFQTANRTRQAEAQVLAARATLRVTEQTVLLSAVTAYMNLLRDSAIFDLQKRNVEVLQEQLRQTRDRFNVGEVTRTDVAQAESSLAAGRSQVLTAESNYKSSTATYRQVIGTDPGKLAAGTPVDRFSPNNLPTAISLTSATHPSVTTAQYNVDVAQSQVKVAEGALYPTLSIQGSAQKNFFPLGSLNTVESYSASVLGQLSVPLYQGGAEYSAIRQAKETLGQKRLDFDTARDQVRQFVVQSWGQLEAAKANIDATTSQVQSSEIALNGVREEARVGQRTTYDVLVAQQNLVNARVALVTAQRDRVVASYTLLSAVGRLAPEVLGLNVPIYNAQEHYQQVRDSWTGVRTPSGR
ncbi:MAG: TolC family outer membrane protein [Rhizobiales bacterium]|nr:TolC family outer membrane protein [Hyphomicrobiales bacterium]